MAHEAPNVAYCRATVKKDTSIKDVFLGTLGDNRHQRGAGDHTTHSTHTGKYGYPTQGKTHAIDIGAPDAVLLDFESWLRREIKAGRRKGIKYVNVLNRHWNFQTWGSYNAMKAGTLRPRYSGDHHLHISFENGDVDGDIWEDFIAYRDNKGKKPAPTTSASTTSKGDDDMTPKELLDTKIESSAYSPAKTVGDLLKFGYIANENVKKEAAALREELAELQAQVQRLQDSHAGPAAPTPNPDGTLTGPNGGTMTPAGPTPAPPPV